uniref:C2H2-type domain-containing protein n=1 Tax=Plectus sambesii TaxID=2011161 RepID=A0A914VYD8_9BILA
ETGRGLQVTHKELQNRALTLFNLLKDTGEIEKNATFSASQGWLWNFFNRHLVCQQCGQECLDALASAHIYQNHINERDAVKCPYCPYGVPYAIAEVKRHITAKHPGQPVDVIDRRGDLQNLYLHWRSICFPEIGTGVRKQTGSPLASMVPSAPVSMVMTSPGPLTIDLADENEDEEDDDDRQPLAVGDGVGQRANSKQINQNSRNKQKCYECGTEVTELWLPRHVWKHMSEELNINCFKCRVSGCNYETYLKRSLDSHCSYHEKGKTTDHFGFIDKRNDFTDEYNSCLKRCFGDAASLLKLGQGSEDFQDDSPLLTDENGSQRHSFDDFPEISAEDIESVSAAISDLNIWCHLCEMPVLRDTVEDHVWQKHLDGQMPFACSQCSEKFLTQIDVELHWKVHHPDSGEMDINQDTEAMDRFEATMAECFPDMSDPGFIKIEPEGPDAEYERSAFD